MSGHLRQAVTPEIAGFLMDGETAVQPDEDASGPVTRSLERMVA